MANFPFCGGSIFGRNPYLNKQPRLEIYTSTTKLGTTEFWWRIYMSSDIVAASSEGYSTRALCIDNLKKIANHIVELERTCKLV
jgi:uncharacterized protein YegP (UPF0339 family)